MALVDPGDVASAFSPHAQQDPVLLFLHACHGVSLCALADLGHTPPLRHPILSFLHTFLPKSAHIRGPHPLMGPHTPLTGLHPPMGNPGSATGACACAWGIQI